MSFFNRLPIAFALSVVACSSGGSGPSSQPVIDTLSVPTSFTVSGTAYTVQGTITYHDDSATVTQLHEVIPTFGLDTTTTIQGAQGSGTAQIELGFQATQAIPSGTQVEIDVSVLDDNNVESNVEVEQITVP